MTLLTPTGMNSTGQFIIAGPSDVLRESAFYNNTITATLTNSAAEVSLIPTGTSTHTILANTVLAGTVLYFYGTGIYTTPVTTSSITLRLKIGSTTLCSVTTSALLNSATNKSFSFQGNIKVLTTGASGTALGGGAITYQISGVSPAEDWLTQTSASTIDFTVDQVLDLTGQWDSASTTRSATIQNATILQYW